MKVSLLYFLLFLFFIFATLWFDYKRDYQTAIVSLIGLVMATNGMVIWK